MTQEGAVSWYLRENSFDNLENPRRQTGRWLATIGPKSALTCPLGPGRYIGDDRGTVDRLSAHVVYNSAASLPILLDQSEVEIFRSSAPSEAFVVVEALLPVLLEKANYHKSRMFKKELSREPFICRR